LGARTHERLFESSLDHNLAVKNISNLAVLGLGEVGFGLETKYKELLKFIRRMNRLRFTIEIGRDSEI